MHTIQVFAEYKIQAEKRQDYLRKIDDIAMAMQQIGVDDFIVYEGVDQPGLFVEMFHVPTMDAYRKIKRKRCEDKAAPGVFWQSINDCLEGGTDRLHMWAFAPISKNGSDE
ncbi:MFS transporter [Aneurinibacillus sp. BA2021]|nr:MFS transporter [Aneurinibacillus sp. BA2021]